MDVLSAEQRRLNMSRIRGRDTKPERVVRQGLHARGYRYRLHRRDLPGTPDLVFPSRRAVIFVNGCFWHGHGCSMSTIPSTRREFWTTKIERTRTRDAEALKALTSAHWRCLTIWECVLRGPNRWSPERLFEECAAFLEGTAGRLELT